MKADARSKITNGKVLLAGIDGRSRAARRYRDVLDSLLSQLGREPSEADHLLARRAASLSVHLEGLDAARVNGQPVDDNALTTHTNALRRVLSDLGLSARRRRPLNRRAPVAASGAIV